MAETALKAGASMAPPHVSTMMDAAEVVRQYRERKLKEASLNQSIERLTRLLSGEPYWLVYPAVADEFEDVRAPTAECWAESLINWDRKAVCDAILSQAVPGGTVTGDSYQQREPPPGTVSSQ